MNTIPFFRTCTLIVLFIAACQVQAAKCIGTQEQMTESALWYGELDAEGRVFRFLVSIIVDAQGNYTNRGTLKSLDEGNQVFEIEQAELSDETFAFQLPSTKAEFHGTVSDGGKKMAGKWKQSGHEFDLSFASVKEAPSEELNSYWIGQLDGGIQKLDIAIRERSDGKIFFDSLSQQLGGFVVIKKVSGEEISFEVPAIRGSFKGTKNADETEIVGQWKQGLFPIKLTLAKAPVPNEIYAIPSRPQTPKGPFPYLIENFVVANPNAEGVKLAGTLTLPSEGKKVAAIVLISGSGPQDRDETIAGHEPFLVIADHLTKAGFAVLRFDDRGVGISTGDFASATSVDFANDTRALIAFLRDHPRIDPERIILCGHSEGGLIAPMVAAEDSKVAGMILLAAPGVNGEQVILSQTRLILKASGVDEEEIKRQQDIQKIAIDLVKREPPLGIEILTREAKTLLKNSLTNHDLSSEEADRLIELSVVQLASPWFRYFLTYDPADTLNKIRCPTLVLSGELDLQVDATVNVVAIQGALRDAGAESVESHTFPGLNHLFQPAKIGTPSEYGEIEQTISPSVLETITNWLAKLELKR
jgi:uncharacterized protein